MYKADDLQTPYLFSGDGDVEDEYDDGEKRQRTKKQTKSKTKEDTFKPEFIESVSPPLGRSITDSQLSSLGQSQAVIQWVLSRERKGEGVDDCSKKKAKEYEKEIRKRFRPEFRECSSFLV